MSCLVSYSEHRNTSLQVFQGSLIAVNALEEVLESWQRQEAQLKDGHAHACADRDTMKKEVTRLFKVLKQEQVSALESDDKLLTSFKEVASQKEELKVLNDFSDHEARERLKLAESTLDLGAYQDQNTCIAMIEAFKRGEHSSWNLEKDEALLKDTFP